MNTKRTWSFLLTLALVSVAFSVYGLIPDDADGDGVPDADDACPAESSAPFDRDGDGCVDEFTGARHVEYWGVDDATITYVINDQGAPGVAGDSDMAAVQDAVSSWMDIPGTELDFVYGGTTTQTDSDGMDGINLVTFVDGSFPFSSLVLAVGLSTSFEVDTTIDGRVYRPGEIFDTDMVFNPTKTFKTAPGPGIDIQSVATHEAGHLFGISHSAIESATMFYVLPGGNAARTLELDDELVYRKAYGTPSELANLNRLDVIVTDGQTSDPVPGAIVFVTDAAGDTAACDYTLANGRATFPGLPNGTYYVSIHPLNGTSPIGFIAPGNINAYVAEIAVENFVPESYDGAESNTDDPAARAPLTVSGGSAVPVAIVTNIDATPPTVVSSSPPNNIPDMAIDGAYRVQFSEPIDDETVGAAFSLRKVSSGSAQAGTLAILLDDSVVVFIPSPPLEFSTDYRLTFTTALKDQFGNSLASDFMIDLTTEAEPPLSITSLVPNKGVVGGTVTINGQGFEDGATVDFAGAAATVISVAERRIVTTVPEGASSGVVTVRNPDLTASNALTFTVLTQAEVARGWESGQVRFDAKPQAVALTPDGSYAYVATDQGVEAVVVDAAQGNYLVSTPIDLGAGAVDIAVTPSGTRTYAVSSTARTLVEIMSDPTTGLAFNTVLSTRPVSARPLGIVIDPSGDRAYIATDESEVQVWDIRLGSETYRRQINTVPSLGGVGVTGALAVTPSGDRMLFGTDDGTLRFYDPSVNAVVATIAVGLDIHAITIDAPGQRAYVAHGNGDVSVINLDGPFPFQVQDIASGGSLRGMGITPGASYLYATDRALDQLKLIDLVEDSRTFRSVVGEIPAAVDPVDVAISPDGFYAFSLLQGDPGALAESRMLVSTIGVGPTLSHIHPIAGPIGTFVVLRGSQFGEGPDGITVNFNGVRVPNAGSGSGQELVVAVPSGATSGQVTVEIEQLDGSIQISNPLNFQVLGPSSGSMRFAATLEPTEVTGAGIEGDIEVSPKGDIAVARYDDNTMRIYDLRTGSAQFHQNILSLAPATALGDIEFTADGKTMFFVDQSGPTLRAFVASPSDPNFGEMRPIDSGGFNAGTVTLAASPNNVHLLIHDSEVNQLHLYDVSGIGNNESPQPGPSLTPAGNLRQMVFHPTGRAAYLAIGFPDGVQVINTDPRVPEFGTAVQFVPMITTDFPPTCSIDVSPDGTFLYAWTIDTGGRGVIREMHAFAIGDPATGLSLSDPAITEHGPETPASFIARDLQVSPRGDRAIRSSGQGFFLFDPADPTTVITPTVGVVDNSFFNEFRYTPDGSRVYVASQAHDFVRVYDFATAGQMVVASGNNQTGVSGEPLAAPIRVRVIEAIGTTTVGTPGVPVTFQVELTDGLFEIPCDGPLCLATEVIVVTDDEGYAQADWVLGDLGNLTAEAVAEGVTGSPVVFQATSVVDPSSLPLAIAEVIPLNNATGVSVSTAALVTFSRPIDPSTIDPTSLFIQTAVDATLVPVAFGFTDDNRRVSLTPLTALAPSTDYEIVSTADIESDNGGDVLSNPGTSTFETQAPPPLSISSIYPPSALPGTQVVIAGTSFAAGANTVSFGGATSTGTGSSVVLTATIPASAAPGTVNVTVNNGTTTSNALPFYILAVTTTVIDDVIATIAAGSGAKSVVVSGDGALCYAVGTDGDVVIPVGIEDEFTYPSIPVGDQPFAIVINPAGTLAYVANFNSGSVSVIDVDPTSLDYHRVVNTIEVGVNPVDVAVDPDGSRLAVANAGSMDVSIVDIDETSETYNRVTASVQAGSSAKSVVISGDGTLYVGTSTGVLVVDESNNVTANLASSGAKSVVVSGDGTLLFVLTVDDEVLVFDIMDGSPTENRVVATIGAGSSAKSVVVSGDGTLLYIVQEDTDEVLVVAIEIIPGVGALGPDAAAFSVDWHVVTTLETGDDPADIALDPTGSGRVIVANAGDGTLTVFGPSFEALPAVFKVVPGIIVPKLPAPYVLGIIQLASPLSVHDIDIASIRVFGTVAVADGMYLIDDVTHDGVDDLSVLFCRDEFLAAMPENGEHVDVTATGLVGGEAFEGTDEILVLRPTILTPTENEMVSGGHPYEITWTAPLDILPCDKVKIEWRPDGDDVDDIDCDFHTHTGDEMAVVEDMDQLDRLDEGAAVADPDWILVANNVANDGNYTWNVPAGHFPNARLRITLLWFGLKVGSSEVPFEIEMPLPVRLTSFDVTIEDGDAVLRWETSYEAGMEGYDIVRSEDEHGRYDVVSKETIQSSGSESGGSYEYHDETVSANRTYWYKLREVSTDGLGMEHGPYSVTYRLSNELKQNVPNPFNPTTTIGYALAADNDVTLTIYDVGGRKVKTLVHERQRADAYKVTWDGMNDAGTRVASGVYFYKLVAGKFTQTRKMLLLK